MEFSIVIPVYNEKHSVVQLYHEIVTVMHQLKKTFEIIFVDDGSTDKSFEALEEVSEEAKKSGVNLTCIVFRGNFGKSAALQAGFKEAKGQVIITMDGDLQDDPSEIPHFIEKLEEGYDLVSGWKFNRKDPLKKKLPSKLFNFVTSLLTGVKLHDFNCCFKAYKRQAIENLNIYGELHRYIPALVCSEGFKIAEIRVNHRARKFGKTKYGLKRFFEGPLDLITVIFLTKFIKKPLHFFGNFGLISSFAGIFIVAGLYLRKFILGITIGSNQFLFLLGVLLILVGMQFFSMGLLGELMIKLNTEEVKRYNIKEIIRS